MYSMEVARHVAQAEEAGRNARLGTSAGAREVNAILTLPNHLSHPINGPSDQLLPHELTLVDFATSTPKWTTSYSRDDMPSQCGASSPQPEAVSPPQLYAPTQAPCASLKPAKPTPPACDPTTPRHSPDTRKAYCASSAHPAPRPSLSASASQTNSNHPVSRSGNSDSSSPVSNASNSPAAASSSSSSSLCVESHTTVSPTPSFTSLPPSPQLSPQPSPQPSPQQSAASVDAGDAGEVEGLRGACPMSIVVSLSKFLRGADESHRSCLHDPQMKRNIELLTAAAQLQQLGMPARPLRMDASWRRQLHARRPVQPPLTRSMQRRSTAAAAAAAGNRLRVALRSRSSPALAVRLAEAEASAYRNSIMRIDETRPASAHELALQSRLQSYLYPRHLCAPKMSHFSASWAETLHLDLCPGRSQSPVSSADAAAPQHSTPACQRPVAPARSRSCEAPPLMLRPVSPGVADASVRLLDAPPQHGDSPSAPPDAHAASLTEFSSAAPRAALAAPAQQGEQQPRERAAGVTCLRDSQHDAPEDTPTAAQLLCCEPLWSATPQQAPPRSGHSMPELTALWLQAHGAAAGREYTGSGGQNAPKNRTWPCAAERLRECGAEPPSGPPQPQWPPQRVAGAGQVPLLQRNSVTSRIRRWLGRARAQHSASGGPALHQHRLQPSLRWESQRLDREQHDMHATSALPPSRPGERGNSGDSIDTAGDSIHRYAHNGFPVGARVNLEAALREDVPRGAGVAMPEWLHSTQHARRVRAASATPACWPCAAASRLLRIARPPSRSMEHGRRGSCNPWALLGCGGSAHDEWADTDADGTVESAVVAHWEEIKASLRRENPDLKFGVLLGVDGKRR